MNAKCSVVIADDSHDSADTLVALLSAMGYAAMAVYDGREAVQACCKLMPDVAILDIEMPFLDGCAAARIIRLSAHPPKIIASLSAQRHWDEPMKSEGGAFDVRLSKPARIEQLRELMTRAIEQDPDVATAMPGAEGPDKPQAIDGVAPGSAATSGAESGHHRDRMR